MKSEKLELTEHFGHKGDTILLQKLQTLPGCYSSIKRWWGLKRKFILYTAVSWGHPILVYKKTIRFNEEYPFFHRVNLKRFLCTDVHHVGKIENNIFKVITSTSIYIITLKLKAP